MLYNQAPMPLLRFEALPTSREGFKSNEIPLSQTDIRHIAQVCGAQVAANAEVMVQMIREQGGVNPNTVKVVFPSDDGIKGPVDEDALIDVITNYSAWFDQPLPH